MAPVSRRTLIPSGAIQDSRRMWPIQEPRVRSSSELPYKLPASDEPIGICVFCYCWLALDLLQHNGCGHTGTLWGHGDFHNAEMGTCGRGDMLVRFPGNTTNLTVSRIFTGIWPESEGIPGNTTTNLTAGRWSGWNWQHQSTCVCVSVSAAQHAHSLEWNLKTLSTFDVLRGPQSHERKQLLESARCRHDWRVRGLVVNPTLLSATFCYIASLNNVQEQGRVRGPRALLRTGQSPGRIECLATRRRQRRPVRPLADPPVRE